jgi:hypothetical protein
MAFAPPPVKVETPKGALADGVVRKYTIYTSGAGLHSLGFPHVLVLSMINNLCQIYDVPSWKTGSGR